MPIKIRAKGTTVIKVSNSNMIWFTISLPNLQVIMVMNAIAKVQIMNLSISRGVKSGNYGGLTITCPLTIVTLYYLLSKASVMRM